MDSDEYEYLEKTVENAGNRSKNKEKNESKRDKVYRKNEEEDDEQEERRRKKSRSEGENGDERKRDERERRRDRDRNGDRDRDRDRERRDREKERELRREKENREKEIERSRRSSSRSRPHGSRELERSSSQSRPHGSRELERSSRDRDREIDSIDGRRFKEKKEEEEPEVDPERDQRTVFAYQMPLKVTQRDVYEFFSKAGKVRDVRLIMDRNSRRSKGVGYIEFYDAMSVPMAIALSGQLFLGQPVMVKPSEAEKNLVQCTTSSGSNLSGPFGPNDRKLYVGNLHFNVTEHQLRQIFEPYGPVELVQLPLDLETGQCKGFGFVQFTQVEHAKAAQSCNGKVEIAGRYLKVSCVTEHVGGQQDTGTTASDFDDDDGGGLSLNARSRLLLMGKLDRSGLASSIAVTHGVPVTNSTTLVQNPIPLLSGHTTTLGPTLPAQVLPSPTSEPIGTPSECLLLKNLFDPATETDPEFDLDIKEDVEEECSKFGRVKHIYVDKHSDGHVYLRFDNKTAAMEAQRGMHKRWFARRLISAIFMQPKDYEARFTA